MVTVIAVAERTRPSSIEPLSPMKTRAGWKLCARKPTHAPARAAESKAPVVARVTSLSTVSW